MSMQTTDERDSFYAILRAAERLADGGRETAFGRMADRAADALAAFDYAADSLHPAAIATMYADLSAVLARQAVAA